MKVGPDFAVICKEPGRCIGWPTVALTSAGELLVVFSGDRDAHVCPFGKTQLVRSRDGGRSWTEPETITDGPLDDRDAGIIVLKSGTLLVNWFTSLAFEDEDHRKHYPKEMVDGWQRRIAETTDEERKKCLGRWTRRSTDGGGTWKDWVRTPVGSPHGPVQLADGRLLYLGRGQIDGKTIIGVAESLDEGRSWELIWSNELLTEESLNLCEAHQAQLPDGRIVGMFRYEGSPANYLWQTWSDDGGRSWSVPRVTPIWGYPPHLLALRDGRLLVTYGYRREPYGQRACLSCDGGKTWDVEDEIVLRDDAPNGDLGYPASVEMPDGTILTVYYQIDRPGEKTCLMATRWTPPPKPQRKARKKDGLKVEMGEPVVVTTGPTEERRWGFYQFPSFSQTKDGQLVAVCQVADDSHDDAGERHPSPHLLSRDGGKSWDPFTDEDSLQRTRILRDGTGIRSLDRPKRSVADLGIKPVRQRARIGHYDNEFDLYRYEDLPDDMKGIRTEIRKPGGGEEEFIAPLDFPGLLLPVYRLTWTSAGPVELEGNIRPLVFRFDSTQFLELPDGALLYLMGAWRLDDAGEVVRGGAQMYLVASADGGRSWALRSAVAFIPNEAPWGLYEPTLTRAAAGTLVCVMRTELGGPPEVKRDLWVATSTDDGFSWERPRVLSHFGVEPELITLENGVTAVSYGRPGVEMRFSLDPDGREWSDPYVVRQSRRIGQPDTTCGYTKLVAAGRDRFLVIFSDFCHRDGNWVLHKAIKVRETKVTSQG